MNPKKNPFIETSITSHRLHQRPKGAARQARSRVGFDELEEGRSVSPQSNAICVETLQ
jgi:hypothetical protein